MFNDMIFNRSEARSQKKRQLSDHHYYKHFRSIESKFIPCYAVK